MNTRIALNAFANHVQHSVSTSIASLRPDAQPTVETMTNTFAIPRLSIRHRLALSIWTLLIALGTLAPASTAHAQKLFATYNITVTSGASNGTHSSLTGPLKLYQHLVASNACEAEISIGPYQQFQQRAPGSFVYYSNMALETSGWFAQTGAVYYCPKANWPGSPTMVCLTWSSRAPENGRAASF